MASRTVRLFVSSPFTDFAAERDVLQRVVFPRLKELCASKGLRFQPIDLRWGISEEASRDNRTMRICLRELHRCREHLPPNFMVLLGNRYGWRPLPEILPVELFERLAALMDSANAQLFRRWFRVDQNAVPPVAELQPHDAAEGWREGVEQPLLAALEAAAQALGINPSGIGTSATEQEILEGALQVADAATHVRAFFREGADGDSDAREQLDTLKERLRRHLGDENICRYTELDSFAELAYARLREVIERQLRDAPALSSQDSEAQAHARFGEERQARFVGREDVLGRIAAYLRDGSGKPLALVGSPGSGKSAVMAKAARAAREAHPHARIVARYIGVTPSSMDLVALLREVVGQIYDLDEDEEIPFDLDPLLDLFRIAVRGASERRPIVLFLDALDQLTESRQAESLRWLPLHLPEHVRIVVSASSATVLARIGEGDRIDLGPLTRADGKTMLSDWLAEAGRTLQPEQRAAVLESFAAEGNALWLRTAAAESALLRSWQPPPRFAPGVRALLEQVLDRLDNAEEHGETLVAHTLNYLASARHGLAEDELLDLLSADADVMADFRRHSPQSPFTERLPMAARVRLHNDLLPYLAERQAGLPVMTFYHRSFMEAAVARAPALDWHARLARYFRDAARVGEGWAHAPHALAELPFHLLRGGDADALRALYADIGYLDARFRSQPRSGPGTAECPGVVDFLYELHECAEADELLRQLSRLLSDRATMLVRFPENGAQEIANYLHRYSGSAAARALAEEARRVPALLSLSYWASGASAGHTAPITALAAVPGTSQFLSGAADGSLGYWSVLEAQPLWTTSGHEEAVTSIAVTADGRRALTASKDGSMLVWDLVRGSRRQSRLLALHASEAWVGGFLDDETAVATTAGALFAFDVGSGAFLWRGPSNNFALVEVSPDGAVSCGAEKTSAHQFTVRVFARDGRVAATLGEIDEVRVLRFTADSSAVVFSDHHGYLRAYTLDGAKRCGALLRPPLVSWCCTAGGTVIGCDPAGRVLRITLWPMEGDRLPESAWLHDGATAMAEVSDGLVVAGHEDGSLTLLDVNANAIARRWTSGVALATGALFEDGGAVGVAGSRLQGELVHGRALHRIFRDAHSARVTESPHTRFVSGVAAIGEGLALTVDREGTAVVWEGSHAARIHRVELPLTCCCAWDEGGVGIAGTTEDTVYMIGMGKAVRRIALPGHHDPPGVSAVAAAGRPLQVIAALQNSEVAAAGAREWRVKAGSGMGTAAAIDRCCTFAATGHGFGKVHLWDAATGQERWRLSLHAGPVHALAFGDDGLLYSAGADRRLVAVDPETGAVVAATMLPNKPVALRGCADRHWLVLDSACGLYDFVPNLIV
jgi:WD40 repeat protein